MSGRRAVAAACVGAALLIWLVSGLLREGAAPDEPKSRTSTTAPAPTSALDQPALPSPRKVEAAPPPPKPGPVAPHLPGLVVRRSDGTPLPGVRITLSRASLPAEPPLEAVTDSAGSFDIPVPAPLPGATLVASWSPVTRLLDVGDEVEQPLARGVVSTRLVTETGDYTSGVPRRITLDTGWLLGGHVVDGVGRPLHGALLLAQTGNAASSDEAGAFLIRDIDPTAGHVSVTGSAPGHVTRQVQADAPPAGQPAAHVQLTLPEPGVLAGTVAFANGVPASDVEVICVGADEIGPGPHRTSTDADGAFRFENLPDGRFDLVVRVSDDATRFAASMDAVAETWMRDLAIAGEMPPQQIVLDRGLTLRGTVRDASGRPLPGHLVVARAIREMPCDLVDWSPAASAEAGSEGRFALRRLQPGPWRLCVEGLPQGCAHGDRFTWRALNSPGAGPALAQDGPVPGPPRPTELVFDVQLSATATEVELVVRAPDASPGSSGWPDIMARASREPHFTDLQVELLRSGACVSRGAIDARRGRGWHTDESTAAGLLRFSCPPLLPILRGLHDVQLEHDFGTLSFRLPPVLDMSVVDADSGHVVEDSSVFVHWLGGGRADTLARAKKPDDLLVADRSETRWVLSVEAPGYRRHRLLGEMRAPTRQSDPPRAEAHVRLRKW
jgi:hypothetical protein